MDFAAPQIEIDAFQRNDAGEPLGDIGEIEKEIGAIAGRFCGPRLVAICDCGHLRNRQSWVGADHGAFTE